MFHTRIQIGDIKPLAPIRPQRSSDKAKRKEYEPKQDNRQRNRQARDEDHDQDGHSIDEYA